MVSHRPPPGRDGVPPSTPQVGMVSHRPPPVGMVSHRPPPVGMVSHRPPPVGMVSHRPPPSSTGEECLGCPGHGGARIEQPLIEGKQRDLQFPSDHEVLRIVSTDTGTGAFLQHLVG